MKILYAIATYNQPADLRNLYESIREADPACKPDEIVIISNHSKLTPPGEARIHMNSLRPDASLGYLARTWNQGIQLAFGSLAAPKADWVALCQSDVVFRQGWRNRFEAHVACTGAALVASGPGDQMTLLSREAFEKIGWWDERFTGIGYQEHDYFARAYLRLGPRFCYQGHGHITPWNWPELDLIQLSRVDSSGHSMALNGALYGHFSRKWGGDIAAALLWWVSNPETVALWPAHLDELFGPWEERAAGRFRRSLPLEHNWYPYFYRGLAQTFDHLYVDYVALP